MKKESSAAARGSRRDQFNTLIQLQTLPQEVVKVYPAFGRGYVATEPPENTEDQYSPRMIDYEISRNGRLVRSPGIKTVENLPYLPSAAVFHPTLNATGELLLFAPPFMGIKTSAGTTWYNVGVSPSQYFTAAMFADVLLFSTGVGGTYYRNPGDVVLTAIPGISAARGVVVFGTRVLLGGTTIDGLFEPLGLRWSDARSDFLDWDPAQGAGSELMILQENLPDEFVAFRFVGHEVLGILNRFSIWTATQTGDEFEPYDIRQRITGAGCVSAATAQSTEMGVIYLSDDGVRLFDGNSSKILSVDINPDLLDLNLSLLSRYKSSFDRKKQQYQLHTPDGVTWVYDIQYQRWFRRAVAIDASSIFPTQSPPETWNQLTGTWNADVGSWDESIAGSQQGAPLYFIQGGKLGTEQDGLYTRFDQPFYPEWESPRPTAEELSRQFTKTLIEFVYEGGGSMEVYLPNAQGAYKLVATYDFAQGDDPVNTQRINPRHTGRGLGIKVRVTEGNIMLRKISLHAEDAGPFIGTPAKVYRIGSFNYGSSVRIG